MIRILGLFCVLMVVGMMTGCSVQNWTETSYQAPNWTPSGKIVALKMERKYHEDPISFGDQKEVLDRGSAHIVEMNADGSNESELFEPAENVSMIQVSTSENYIACADGGSGLHIYTRGGSKVSNIDVGDTIYAFDWSPDESKLVLQAGSQPIKVYFKEGNFYKVLSNGAYPSWKMNNKIIFKSEQYSPNRLAFRDIELLSDGVVNITGFSYPQYILSGTKAYLFRSQEIVLFDINSEKTSNINVGIQGYSSPFVSPDGSKIVVTDINDSSAIWLIDVSSNVRTRLR